MTARYWVLVGKELLDSGPEWGRAGLRQLELGPWQPDWTRWVLLEDPGAPPELNGQKVEVTFQVSADGSVTIISRELAELR